MEIPEVVCEVIGGKLALLLPAILKVLLRGQRGSEHEILTLLSSHIIFRLTANGLSSFNVCVCVCVPCVSANGGQRPGIFLYHPFPCFLKE